MALANAAWYLATFTLAAQSLKTTTAGPARAAAAWGAAYASGLATKAPRSAFILALMPAVGSALGRLSGGDGKRSARLASAVALACLGAVLAAVGAVSLSIL